MAHVSLSVLEGLERGLVYHDLPTPVTIGREEDNDIQLNDERVSRVHAKIQEDRSQVIFTDLNSTNGSRINGHPVQLRVLRPGDHLQIGRCTLLYGSDEQIEERARQIGVSIAALTPLSRPSGVARADSDDSSAEFDLSPDLLPENLQLPLFPGGPPALPTELEVGQRARMCDVLSYIHERLREVAFETVDPDEAPANPLVDVPWERWQNLLMLQRDLAKYLRKIVNPDE